MKTAILTMAIVGLICMTGISQTIIIMYVPVNNYLLIVESDKEAEKVFLKPTTWEYAYKEIIRRIDEYEKAGYELEQSYGFESQQASRQYFILGKRKEE